jgi:hypothetical protein
MSERQKAKKRRRDRDATAIGPDDPLRLEDAVEVAFPGGGMTVSGLRLERDRGNLTTERTPRDAAP